MHSDNSDQECAKQVLLVMRYLKLYSLLYTEEDVWLGGRVVVLGGPLERRKSRGLLHNVKICFWVSLHSNPNSLVLWSICSTPIFLMPNPILLIDLSARSTLFPKLDQIIRYLNSWDQIVLFVFGIKSICDFRKVFEYPNSYHQIPNSSIIFKSKICLENTGKSPPVGMKIKDQIFLISFGHKIYK